MQSRIAPFAEATRLYGPAIGLKDFEGCLTHFGTDY